MFKNYVRDRKILGFVEVINMLDDEQKATQRDVDDISHAFRWIGMQAKLPHLNLKDEELKSTIERVTRPAWAGFKTAEEGRTKIM